MYACVCVRRTYHLSSAVQCARRPYYCVEHAQSHYAHITRRYHSEQCAKSARQLKADLAWLKKHRGEARQLEYLKDEILTRVVGFGWGEYKVSSSYESHSCFC